MSRPDEIESLLRRTRAVAPPDLRDRVVTAMRAELRVRVFRPWRAAAAAAACLLWLHLSWSASLNTKLDGGDVRPELNRMARQIHDLAPELPAAETRRLAVLLHAGARARWAAIPKREGVAAEPFKIAAEQ